MAWVCALVSLSLRSGRDPKILRLGEFFGRERALEGFERVPGRGMAKFGGAVEPTPGEEWLLGSKSAAVAIALANAMPGFGPQFVKGFMD